MVLQDPLGLTGNTTPDGSPPERGWMAGRLVDGFELAVDGQPSPPTSRDTDARPRHESSCAQTPDATNSD